MVSLRMLAFSIIPEDPTRVQGTGTDLVDWKRAAVFMLLAQQIHIADCVLHVACTDTWPQLLPHPNSGCLHPREAEPKH